MKYLALLLTLALSSLYAADLPKSITADGTYTHPTYIGKRYVVSVSGTFGGGSLAINWTDGITSTAYAGSPATAATSFTFTAASATAEFVLTGSTTPALAVSLALADSGSSGGTVDNSTVNSAISTDTAATRSTLLTFPGYGSSTLSKGLAGTPANSGELNELVLRNDNSGANVLALENNAASNPLPALTFRVNNMEYGAVGFLGTPSTNPLAPFTFFETSRIDTAPSTAYPFYLLQTSNYSGATGFAQNIRFSLALDGTLAVHDRTGTEKLTLNAAGTGFAFNTATITSVARKTNTITSNSTGANVYGSINQENWNPSAGEGVYTHTVDFASLTQSGSNNVTTGGAGGVIVRDTSINLQGSGGLNNATGNQVWIRSTGTGTIGNGYANFVRSPTASGTAPITNIYGLYCEDLKPTGVTNAYAFKSLGTTTNGVLAGKLRVGATTDPSATLDITGTIKATSYIEGAEETEPAAPSANGYRIFSVDNGSGKTVLKVRFATGASQVLATEP